MGVGIRGVIDAPGVRRCSSVYRLGIVRSVANARCACGQAGRELADADPRRPDKVIFLAPERHVFDDGSQLIITRLPKV